MGKDNFRKEREGVQKDGAGRWQRMKLYNNDNRLHCTGGRGEVTANEAAWWRTRRYGNREKTTSCARRRTTVRAESTSRSGYKGCWCWCAEASASCMARKWERRGEGRYMM